MLCWKGAAATRRWIRVRVRLNFFFVGPRPLSWSEFVDGKKICVGDAGVVVRRPCLMYLTIYVPRFNFCTPLCRILRLNRCLHNKFVSPSETPDRMSFALHSIDICIFFFKYIYITKI